MPIELRKATPDDAERIAAVMIAGMRSAFTGLVPDRCLEWPNSAADWRKTLMNGFAADAFLDVAQTENGLVVGYVMGGITSNDNPYQGEVLQINVLPSYHGRGIGRLLMRHAASKFAAQGIHSLCVKVMENNPNRSFYERLGGLYAGEHPYDWDGLITSECMYGWADTSGLIDQMHNFTA